MTIIRDRCPRCNQLSIRRDTDTTPFACSNPDCDRDYKRLNQSTGPTLAEVIAANAIALAKAINHIDPAGVVYYIRWADRIKIGTTTNLAQRLRGLYHDELLAVEPGGYELEARRHDQFHDALILGQREWFTATPDLVALTRELRAQHGDPRAAARQCEDKARRA